MNANFRFENGRLAHRLRECRLDRRVLANE